MRIYYSKHVSGALKFVWHCLQEGKELEPFHIFIINTYFLMQCGAVKIVPRVQMFWSVLMTSPSFVAWKKLYFGPLTSNLPLCYSKICHFIQNYISIKGGYHLSTIPPMLFWPQISFNFATESTLQEIWSRALSVRNSRKLNSKNNTRGR